MALSGALCVLILGVPLFRNKNTKAFFQSLKEGVTAPAAAMGILWFLAALVLLWVFQYRSCDRTVGNPISTRYFISLVPMSIILPAVMIREFFARFRLSNWMKVNVWIVLTGILILDFLKHTYWVITLW